MFFKKDKPADRMVVSESVSESDISEGRISTHVRCEGEERKLLVWKYSLDDIALGSTIVVHPSQRALFIRNGQLAGILEPGSFEVDPVKIPFLQKLVMKVAGKKPYIHAEIYYINETISMGVKWGVGNIRFLDPESNVPLTIGCFGEMAVQIDPFQADRFVVDLVGTQGKFSEETLMSYFRGKMATTIRSRIAAAIRDIGINIVEISVYLEELSAELRPAISNAFAKYGILVHEFHIMDVKLPEDDPRFRELKEMMGADYLIRKKGDLRRKSEMMDVNIDAEVAHKKRTMEAETDVTVDRIRALGGAEVKKINAEAEAYSRAAQNYSWQEEKDDDLRNREMNILERSPRMMKYYYGVGDEQADRNTKPLEAEKRNDSNTWKCTCGTTNTGNFCQNCGSSRPVADKADHTWVCSCGTTNTGNFCGGCGKARPESNTWICSCGTVNTGNFCGGCGKARGWS